MNIVHLCTSGGILAAYSDWMIWQLSVLGFLSTKHVALLITQTYLARLQFVMQQLQRLGFDHSNSQPMA